MEYELTYADSVEEGTALVERIGRLEDRGAPIDLGFDTEFYGVELGRHSVLARAKVHFASLAWLESGSKLHPRGYSIPNAAVVSATVVRECAEFRALFGNRRYRWFAHNAPVDVHIFHNEGIKIANVANTLTLARYTWPARARNAWGGGGFGLDALGRDVLGEGKLEAFTELFQETKEVWETKDIVRKDCACGEAGCRKRREPDHSKRVWTERVQEAKLTEVPVPLEVVVPGHPLFDRAVRYAAQDAVLAHALKQIIYRELNKQIRDVPWIT